MDRLVREGASFRNSFVTTSLCSPSRSSYLTGQYAHKTGVIDNERTSLSRDGIPTVAALLRQAGYATGYAGKIHIPNFWERDHGFDYFASFPGQGLYFDNPFLVNGKKVPTEGYITDHINRYALEFLKQRDARKPFALFVGHKAVHGPWQPRPDHAHRFDNEWFPLPKTWDDDYQGRPPYLKARRKSWHGLEGMLEDLPKMSISGYSELQRCIAACLMSVDEGLGSILAFLAKTRELDNTIIIYSSDNGFFQGEHGLNDKRAMYEDSIRVPLLVRYPPLIRPGTTFDPMVLNVDLAPTLLDFARVEIPRQIQGRSWKPVLEGKGLGRDGRTGGLLPILLGEVVSVRSHAIRRAHRASQVHPLPERQQHGSYYPMQGFPMTSSTISKTIR